VSFALTEALGLFAMMVYCNTIAGYFLCCTSNRWCKNEIWNHILCHCYLIL